MVNIKDSQRGQQNKFVKVCQLLESPTLSPLQLGSSLSRTGQQKNKAVYPPLFLLNRNKGVSNCFLVVFDVL